MDNTKFQVLTVASMKMTPFWDAAPRLYGATSHKTVSHLQLWIKSK
jgi:hypothetical protein